MTSAQPSIAAASPRIELGFAARTQPGESVSGDLHLLELLPNGLLLGLIDGVGHGPHAHFAAKTAATACSKNPTAALDDILRTCHLACTATRGVVLTLARLDLAAGTLHWVGVGNVEAVVNRGQAQRKSLRLWAGLVGVRLPEARVESMSIAAGDLVVMATDGIRPGFGEHLRSADSVGQIASNVLAAHMRDSDDATVVVLRVPGPHP